MPTFEPATPPVLSTCQALPRLSATEVRVEPPQLRVVRMSVLPPLVLIPLFTVRVKVEPVAGVGPVQTFWTNFVPVPVEVATVAVSVPVPVSAPGTVAAPVAV